MWDNWHNYLLPFIIPEQKSQLLTVSQINLLKPPKLLVSLLIQLDQSSYPPKCIRGLLWDKTLKGAGGEITNYPWLVLTLLISLLYQQDLATAVPVKPDHLQSNVVHLCYSNISHLTHTLRLNGISTFSLKWLCDPPKRQCWIISGIWPKTVSSSRSLGGAYDRALLFFPWKQGETHGSYQSHMWWLATL